MKIRVKEDVKSKATADNYIEIDLTDDELANLTRGRYPFNRTIIDGKPFMVSVGRDDGKMGGNFDD